MNTIHFHDDFFDGLKSGKKTQTIRYKEDDKTIGRGKAIFDNNIDIEIKIKTISHKKFTDITIEEVKKDGFSSKTDLWTTLLRFYPDLQNNVTLTLIEFETINK